MTEITEELRLMLVSTEKKSRRRGAELNEARKLLLTIEVMCEETTASFMTHAQKNGVIALMGGLASKGRNMRSACDVDGNEVSDIPF